MVVELSQSFAARVSRVVTRLPRMLTEADDYSWVPMGDVLVALHDIDASEAAWPEGTPAPKTDTLIRLLRIEAAARAVADAHATYPTGPAVPWPELRSALGDSR